MTRWAGVLALGAAALSLCCASGAELGDPELMGPFVLRAPQTADCGMAFDPAPELAEATERAAERWSAATGCDVHVDSAGVSLVAWRRMFVDDLPDGHVGISELPNPDGSSRTPCGLSTWRDGRVAIIDVALSSSCELGYAVAHEMGHALAGIQGHALDGVLAPGGTEGAADVITEASLGLVCSSLPCADFKPETP